MRLNPYSGDVSGIKYTLSPEGVLQEVPKKLVVHLRNIRTQGLGGKGSKVAARKWAANAATQTQSLDGLPDEVVENILRQLELTSLAAIAQLSDRYRQEAVRILKQFSAQRPGGATGGGRPRRQRPGRAIFQHPCRLYRRLRGSR
ncbi:F-box protein [Candidatus Sodalis endolongispinus]|uniref:F-box protein n=1 Tax=Candidatus Sodalis endolongispinus TaxID=2812662 RepID=A0ABS5YF48_9GAMM|nr:F-box protein [Candidatus Sodalis endolongispinus]MBT9432716.1 F-box protein [Candidatus Sodalis endolongispinus]